MESILVSSTNRMKSTARVFGGLGGIEIVCFPFPFKVLLFLSSNSKVRCFFDESIDWIN